MVVGITTAYGTGGTPVGTPLPQAEIAVQSREVLYEATPLLRFDQVAVRKEELGEVRGREIKFLRYNALVGSSSLTENIPMPVHALTASEISITVSEEGISVGVSELRLQTSFDDVMQSMARQLGRHYATTQDGQFRDVLLSSANVLYSGQLTRTTLGAANGFNTALVKDAVELLATNKTPRIGDSYICFVHPHCARSLRDDPAWINAKNYGAPGEILRGEVGKYEDVRFIETTQMPWILSGLGGGAAGSIFVDGVDTGVDSGSYNANFNVYQSVMVGDHALGHAVALDVEMRDNGVTDHGRTHQLAWYGIYGQGFIEDGHCVVLESV